MTVLIRFNDDTC